MILFILHVAFIVRFFNCVLLNLYLVLKLYSKKRALILLQYYNI